MLKELIAKYGKQKVNTLTKYPSILTLHKLGERGRLTNEFTTDIRGEQMFATEKIDGTNVRIICWKNEYLIGSREFILHHCDDLYYDMAQGIVDGLKELNAKMPHPSDMTVFYGELFGGKMSAQSKQYGTNKIGFRLFDIAVYSDLSILEKSNEDISRWRERETADGIVYGQNYLHKDVLNTYSHLFDIVPSLPFDVGDMSHRTILDNLRTFIPETNVALSELALKKPEGVVLRNNSRTKIVKVRYEDYERTLR